MRGFLLSPVVAWKVPGCECVSTTQQTVVNNATKLGFPMLQAFTTVWRFQVGVRQVSVPDLEYLQHLRQMGVSHWRQKFCYGNRRAIQLTNL